MQFSQSQNALTIAQICMLVLYEFSLGMLRKTILPTTLFMFMSLNHLSTVSKVEVSNTRNCNVDIACTRFQNLFSKVYTAYNFLHLLFMLELIG